MRKTSKAKNPSWTEKVGILLSIVYALLTVATGLSVGSTNSSALDDVNYDIESCASSPEKQECYRSYYSSLTTTKGPRRPFLT